MKGGYHGRSIQEDVRGHRAGDRRPFRQISAEKESASRIGASRLHRTNRWP